jgi:hypothetical protein
VQAPTATMAELIDVGLSSSTSSSHRDCTGAGKRLRRDKLNLGSKWIQTSNRKDNYLVNVAMIVFLFLESVDTTVGLLNGRLSKLNFSFNLSSEVRKVGFFQ